MSSHPRKSKIEKSGIYHLIILALTDGRGALGGIPRSQTIDFNQDVTE